MPAPNGQNIVCGSGSVWFNRFVNGLPTAYRFLGNVSKLEVTPNITTIEKKGSTNSARAVIARAITESKMEVALTLDEYTKENVALALLGIDSAFTQSMATITGGTLGDAILGYWLDTGKEKIVVTDVKSGSNTYDEGDDYLIDSDAGLIYVVPNGAIVDGDTLTWDGSVPAFNTFQIQAMQNGNIEGALRFVSSADQVGPRQKVDVWRVAMTPDGAIGLLGDSFAEIGLKGEALIDPTKPAGEEFARSIFL